MHHLVDHWKERDHIVFDWNGTLLNDIDLCVEVVSELAQEQGLPPLTRERYREVFRFPIKDYYADLGFDFTRTTYEAMTEKFIARYHARAMECGLFPGTVEMLTALRDQKKGASVLSAANEGALKELLENYRLSHFFDHIYGLDDHYAVSKVARGQLLIEKLNIEKERILMIGDTDHDVEVAEAMGIDILLLGDGHQHPDRLLARHTNVLATRYP